MYYECMLWFTWQSALSLCFSFCLKHKHAHTKYTLRHTHSWLPAAVCCSEVLDGSSVFCVFSQQFMLDESHYWSCRVEWYSDAQNSPICVSVPVFQKSTDFTYGCLGEYYQSICLVDWCNMLHWHWLPEENNFWLVFLDQILTNLSCTCFVLLWCCFSRRNNYSGFVRRHITTELLL